MTESNSGAVRLAKRADQAAIRSIWEQSFGDDPSYIDNFLKFLATDENTVVREEDGTVVAMAFLIDCEIHTLDGDCKAYYFYAAATEPEYRCRGYMGEILRYCKELAKERDVDYLLLVPANHDLFRYYARFGFRPCVTEKTVKIPRYELERIAHPGTTTADSAPDFDTVRRAAFHGISHVVWSRTALKYVFFEHTWCGGKAAFRDGGYLLYDPEEKGVVRIKEVCCADWDSTFPALAEQLIEYTDAEYYVFTVPAGSPLNARRSRISKTGMGAPITDKGRALQNSIRDLYLGFTLG